ncbi:major facilitator superfamily domain-containing protein [Nemania diffusa]|nr:major facilitator superfamily domain-containing protein [Nemania diffusa]
MTSRQQAAERSLHEQHNPLPKEKIIPVFLSLAIPLLVTFIDQNGIGVTLPTIARDLDAEDSISWAGTSSLIANASCQMLYGRLSDIFGRKAIYLGAISCLAIAELLCSFAQNDVMFYVFRGIAGIGGGGLINLSMIIVSDVVSLEEKGYYQGILGAFIGMGNVIGPFLAAAFITHISWRAFFWTTAPLTAVLGGISLYTLPSNLPTRSFRESAKKIDYGGVLLSTMSIIFLLIPISGGGAYFPWVSPMVISMLVLGSIALLLFIQWEWRIARLPVIPMQIFRNSDVSILLVQNFFLGGVYQALIYYLPLYLQNVRRFSVMQSAGIVAIPVGVQAVASALSGRYISQVKRWKMVVCTGLFLWTLGAGLVLLYRDNSSMGLIAGPLVMMGFGIGCSFQPILTALQSHATRSRRAVIISTRNFFRCAGGSAGLGISAAVLQAVLKKSLPQDYQYLALNAYTLPEIKDADVGIVLNAYMAASRAVFVLQLSLVSVCLIGCVFVRDHGLRSLEEEDEEEIVGNEELAHEQQGPRPNEKTVAANRPNEGVTTMESEEPAAD